MVEVLFSSKSALYDIFTNAERGAMLTMTFDLMFVSLILVQSPLTHSIDLPHGWNTWKSIIHQIGLGRSIAELCGDATLNINHQ